jgi:ubiquinone/menaquinone biosynthesis C-methylase UbiE
MERATPDSRVTRGQGLLEGFLAKRRSNMANKLIPADYRQGRILDIGCGSYPFFLLNTDFSTKHGLDKAMQEDYRRIMQSHDIILTNHDIEKSNKLPFDDEYFNIITMLAVFEHIEEETSTKLLNDIYRILKPGGMYIMTTPSVWTDNLLKFMAKLRLVSSVEIEEHKALYNHVKICSILEEANFSKEKLRFGYFEMFMNMWVTATK